MHYGINDARNWWMGSRHINPGQAYPCEAHRALADRDLDKWSQSGKRFRCVIDIGQMDTNGDGTIDSWTFTDALMKRCAERGVKVLPMVWATSPDNSVRVPRAMDTIAARLAFANAVKAFLNRYKSGASWWASIGIATGGAMVDIHTVEVWNEPNQRFNAGVGYWDAAHVDYGKLLGVVWQKTNEAVPGFKLISGGLAETSTNGMTPADWLGHALAHSATDIGYAYSTWPGGDPYFSVKGVGFHAYGWAPQGDPAQWTAQRAVANQNAFRVRMHQWFLREAPKTWVTEFGWRRTQAGYPNTYTDAEITQRYIDLHSGLAADTNVEAMYAYNYRNGNSGNVLDDGFGMNGTVGNTDAGNTSQAQAGAQYSFGNWWMYPAT